MGIIDNRLSTVPVTADWLPPDERERPDFVTDYEAGPIALNDPSEGLFYQPWTLTWAADDFTLTPETTGSPSVVLSHANVTQCTLAFDQNGNIAIGFTAADQAKLYWYDTLAASYVTTDLAVDVIFPTVYLDDKRTTQTNSSDILLLYTRSDGGGGFNMYFRQQRERYNTERLLQAGTAQYLYKGGMHFGLRGQIALLTSLQPPAPPVTYNVVNGVDSVINGADNVVATF